VEYKLYKYSDKFPTTTWRHVNHFTAQHKKETPKSLPRRSYSKTHMRKSVLSEMSQQLLTTQHIYKKHDHHSICIRYITRYRKRSYAFHYKKSIGVFKKAFSMCKQIVEPTEAPFHTVLLFTMLTEDFFRTQKSFSAHSFVCKGSKNQS
jgi:hypothetical protein